MNREFQQSNKARKLWPIVRAIVIAAVFSILFYQIYLSAKAVSLSEFLDRINWVVILFSLVLIMCALLVSATLWHHLLALNGAQLNWTESFQIFTYSHLWRYLPGKVWTIIGRVTLSKTSGISRETAAQAAVLESLIAVMAGLSLSLFILPGTQSFAPISWLLLVVLIASLSVTLHPKVFGLLANTGLRLLGKQAIRIDYSYHEIVTGFCIQIFAWYVFGFGFFALIKGLDSTTVITIHESTCVFASAWVIGYLSFLMPAGIGVRETVLISLLTLWLPIDTATASALLSRLLSSLSDFIGVIIAFKLGRGKIAESEFKPCPLCKTSGKFLFAQEDINFHIHSDVKHAQHYCDKCAIYFQKPIDVDMLGSYYPKHYFEHSRGPFMEWIDIKRNSNRVKSLTWRAEKGVVYDIGCGNGALLEALRDHGWRAVGTDLNADNAEQVQTRTGCTVIGGPDFLARLPEGDVSVVSLMHVLEHEQEPDKLLAGIHRCLLEKGRLVLAVPNGASVIRWVFGRYWAGFDLPRHRWTFTPRSISRILQNNGFSIERRRGRFSDEMLDLVRSAKLVCREIGLSTTVMPPIISGLLFLPMVIASSLGYGAVMFVQAKKN